MDFWFYDRLSAAVQVRTLLMQFVSNKICIHLLEVGMNAHKNSDIQGLRYTLS